MQRATRNVRVDFSEERRRKEEEQTALLQQYQQMRDAEAVVKEKVGVVMEFVRLLGSKMLPSFCFYLLHFCFFSVEQTKVLSCKFFVNKV